MKSYILVFTGGVTVREVIAKTLNEIPEVYTWRYDMESCFYILSENNAKDISNAIKAKYPSIGLHVITKLGEDYWGNLTKESWHMLQKCEVMPKPEE